MDILTNVKANKLTNVNHQTGKKFKSLTLPNLFRFLARKADGIFAKYKIFENHKNHRSLKIQCEPIGRNFSFDVRFLGQDAI